ncbi:hypothetical protein CABS03_02179 [Colletotrichum abscissum]|uniref:Uncharacterized protein n=1 Tax=Colletotrichum abscissum TaxID=1671311 RepID=A0A9P9XJ37_9PEZI|nr:hypothetical protein CABS02_05195 [Colletotrichum abscissum]
MRFFSRRLFSDSTFFLSLLSRLFDDRALGWDCTVPVRGCPSFIRTDQQPEATLADRPSFLLDNSFCIAHFVPPAQGTPSTKLEPHSSFIACSKMTNYHTDWNI